MSMTEAGEFASLPKEAFDKAKESLVQIRNQLNGADYDSDSKNSHSTQDVIGTDKEECLVSVSMPNHTNTLAAAICAARTETTQADACLFVQGKVFAVHSLVVSTFSKVIREGLSNKNPRVMLIDNVSAEVMSYILDFMYGNLAEIREGNLLKFLMAAKYLQIEILDTPEFLKLQQELQELGFPEREAAINNTASLKGNGCPNITIPSSVSVFKLDGDGRKTASQMTKVKEVFKKHETGNANDDTKNHTHCCSSCRKADDSEKEKKEEANRERETLARKLEKCGTKITGHGFASFLDVPSWLFSSPNISLTPVKQEVTTEITPVKHRGVSTPEDNHSPSVGNKTPKTPKARAFEKVGHAVVGPSPAQALSPMMKRNLQYAFRSPSHQPFNTPQGQVRYSLSGRSGDSVQQFLHSKPGQVNQIIYNQHIQQDHLQAKQDVRSDIVAPCSSRVLTQHRGVPARNRGTQIHGGVSVGSPIQFHPGRVGNLLKYGSPESRVIPGECRKSVSSHSSMGRGISAGSTKSCVLESAGDASGARNEGKKQVPSLYSAPDKRQRPTTICGFPFSKSPPVRDFSLDANMLENRKEALQIEDDVVTVTLNVSEAEVISSGVKCGRILEGVVSPVAGSKEEVLTCESIVTQPTCVTEGSALINSTDTPNVSESAKKFPVDGPKLSSVQPCVMQEQRNALLKHGQDIQEEAAKSRGPQLPSGDLEIGHPDSNSQECSPRGADSSFTSALPEAQATSAPVKKQSRGEKRGRPNKRFSCSVCHIQLLTSMALHMHMRVHSGGKYFFCSSCSFSSYSLKNLKSHVARKHKGRRLRESEKSHCIVPAVSPNLDVKAASKRHKERPKPPLKQSQAKPITEKLDAGMVRQDFPLNSNDKACKVSVKDSKSPVELNTSKLEHQEMNTQLQKCSTFMEDEENNCSPMSVSETSINNEDKDTCPVYLFEDLKPE